MYGCGHRKKRSCANCGHVHKGKFCGRWIRREKSWFVKCVCHSYRERKSRAKKEVAEKRFKKEMSKVWEEPLGYRG